MPAPKGNTNAARPGREKLYRVRVNEPDLLPDISLMDTFERGIALEGYLIWKDLGLFDDYSFIEWIEKQTNNKERK